MRRLALLVAVPLLVGCGEEAKQPRAPSTTQERPAPAVDRQGIERDLTTTMGRLAAPLDEVQLTRWIERLEAHARAHPGEPIDAKGDDRLLQALVEAKFRFLEAGLPVPAPAGAPGLVSEEERDLLRGLLPRYRAVVPRTKGPDGR